MDAILKIIWALLGPTLVNIAITTGLPAVFEWLINKGLPKWLAEGILSIAKAALEQINGIKAKADLNSGQKRFLAGAVKADARRKARDHAIAGYPSGIVKE